MPKILGIDTSNYTTSLAVYDTQDGSIRQQKKLLPVAKGQLGLRQTDQPDDRTEKRRLYENQEPYQPGGFPLFTGGFGGGKLRRALRIRRKRGTDGDLLPGPVPGPQRAALPFTVR